MERFTQVVTVGGGFLMFYNPTMMGSATLGVGGGGGASKEWSKIRDERALQGKRYMVTFIISHYKHRVSLQHSVTLSTDTIEGINW